MNSLVRTVVYLLIPIVMSVLATPIYEVVAAERNILYFAFLAVFSWIATICAIVVGTAILYLFEELEWLNEAIIKVKCASDVLLVLPRATTELSTEFTGLLDDKKVSFVSFVVLLFLGTTVYLMVVGHLLFYAITSVF